MLRPGAIAISLLLASLLPAQRVALPNGTGSLSPATGWTVLTGAELQAAERASDPTQEPARSMLLAVIGELRRDQRTAQHVILHQPGQEPGSLRLVNAFSDDNTATSSEVLSGGTAESVRQTLEPALQADGSKVTYLGCNDAKVFAIGSLVLHFELEHDGVRRRLNHHVVPAGDHVQYFETSYLADDQDAPAAVDALLRTFDGAKEGAFDPILRNMLIGGAIAAVLGTAAARRRQRWLQQHAAKVAAAPTDGQ